MNKNKKTAAERNDRGKRNCIMKKHNLCIKKRERERDYKRELADEDSRNERELLSECTNLYNAKDGYPFEYK